MSSPTQALTKTAVHPAMPFLEAHTAHPSAVCGDRAPEEGVGPAHLVSVYLIEPDSALRAKLARLILANGFHVEIFANAAEFLSYAPDDGVIFVNDSIDARGVAVVIEMLANARLVMPVIAYRDQPTIDNVIAAMRARAVDFLPIEIFETGIREVLETVAVKIKSNRDRRSKVDAAHQRVMCLTNRERQVLEMVVDGLSNKEMARTLEISPRTVEIHRMKMMAKMSARSSSEAVRIWCSANISN